MVRFKPFSKKQILLLTWWCSKKTKNCDAIICDGAVRSGKTVCMSLSFVFWAFSAFDGHSFALCGKTVTALKRNVISPLIGNLKSLGFVCELKNSKGYLEIKYRKRTNRFYFFGGKDEGSAALIQGMTLSGVLLDEVALMPRSFVEQAVARCSVAGSKFWFNCNPEHPFHWFYLEWIQKARQKNAYYLHFTMEDNPSLSPRMKKRYEQLYSGAFYQRFILGKWSAQSGLVYPMFSADEHVVKELPDSFEQYVVSCDYGITNPTSFGLWGKSDGRWYRIDEYYYDSKITKMRKTDEEYYDALEGLIGDRNVTAVVVDPSASSFIERIRRRNRFSVFPAKNDVIPGINRVSEALRRKEIFFSERCADSIREFSLYCWDETGRGDCVKKENDHAMDDIRYFVSAFIDRTDDFFVLSASREG